MINEKDILWNPQDKEWKIILYEAADKGFHYFEYKGIIFEIVYNEYFDGPGGRKVDEKELSDLTVRFRSAQNTG